MRDFKWRTALGLVLVYLAVFAAQPWLWGVLLLLWIVPDLFAGETWLVEPLRRKENPVLYWVVIVTWIWMSVAILSNPLIYFTHGLLRPDADGVHGLQTGLVEQVEVLQAPAGVTLVEVPLDAPLGLGAAFASPALPRAPQVRLVEVPLTAPLGPGARREAPAPRPAAPTPAPPPEPDAPASSAPSTTPTPTIVPTAAPDDLGVPHEVVRTDTPVHVVGLTVRTDEARYADDLALLWSSFMEVDLWSQLRGVVGEQVYAVYDQYDQPSAGSFRVTLGYAVRKADKVPSGMAVATLPASRYAVLTVDPPDEATLEARWDQVARSRLPVARTADAEVYSFDRSGVRIVKAELRVALTD